MFKCWIFQNHPIRFQKLTQQYEKRGLSDLVAPGLHRPAHQNALASTSWQALSLALLQSDLDVQVEVLPQNNSLAEPPLPARNRSPGLRPPTAVGLSLLRLLLSRQIICRKYNSLQHCRDRNRQRGRTMWVTHSSTVVQHVHQVLASGSRRIQQHTTFQAGVRTL